ncbi:unnamed protein product [Amoebophrya sp. A120]|nr:unnamed protein product [Amoebophrya sp. A120]|eukprot:GSA120T00011249001.1
MPPSSARESTQRPSVAVKNRGRETTQFSVVSPGGPPEQDDEIEVVVAAPPPPAAAGLPANKKSQKKSTKKSSTAAVPTPSPTRGEEQSGQQNQKKSSIAGAGPPSRTSTARSTFATGAKVAVLQRVGKNTRTESVSSSSSAATDKQKQSQSGKSRNSEGRNSGRKSTSAMDEQLDAKEKKDEEGDRRNEKSRSTAVEDETGSKVQEVVTAEAGATCGAARDDQGEIALETTKATLNSAKSTSGGTTSRSTPTRSAQLSNVRAARGGAGSGVDGSLAAGPALYGRETTQPSHIADARNTSLVVPSTTAGSVPAGEEQVSTVRVAGPATAGDVVVGDEAAPRSSSSRMSSGSSALTPAKTRKSSKKNSTTTATTTTPSSTHQQLPLTSIPEGLPLVDAAAIDKRKSQTVCMSMVQKHIRLFNKKITAKQKDKNRVSSDPPPKKAASDILRAATTDDLGAIDQYEEDEEAELSSQELAPGHKKRAGLARAFTAPTEALSDFGEEETSGSETKKGQHSRGMNKAAFDTRKSKRAKLDLLTVVEEEEEDISPCAGDELQHPLSSATDESSSRTAKPGSGEGGAGGATGLQNAGESSVGDGEDLAKKKGEHDHSPEKKSIPPAMVRVSKAVEPDYVDVSSASPAQEEAKQAKSSQTPKNPRLFASGVKAAMPAIPEGHLSTGAASKELPEVESASHSAKKLAGTSTGSFNPVARISSHTSSAVPRKSVKTPEPPMPASRLSARVDLSTLKEDESIEAGGDAPVHLAAELGGDGAATCATESIQSEKENAVPAQPGGRQSARISVKESSAAKGSAGRNSARLSSTGRRSVKSTSETPLQEQVKRVSARNSANSLLANSVSKLDFEKVNSDEKKDEHKYGVEVEQKKGVKTSVTVDTTVENAKSPAGSESGLNDRCNTSKTTSTKLVSAAQGQQGQNVKNSVNLLGKNKASVSSTAAVVSAPSKPQPSPFADLVRDLCNSTLFRTMDRDKDDAITGSDVHEWMIEPLALAGYSVEDAQALVADLSGADSFVSPGELGKFVDEIFDPVVNHAAPRDLASAASTILGGAPGTKAATTVKSNNTAAATPTSSVVRTTGDSYSDIDPETLSKALQRLYFRTTEAEAADWIALSKCNEEKDFPGQFRALLNVY